MAYVAPPVFVDGAALTAAELNVMGDDLNDLDARVNAQAGSGVALNRTTALNIVTATWTDIPWDTAVVDTTGWWTSGANVTVPAGVVPPGYSTVVIEIELTARFDANNVGNRAVRVLQNGSVVEFYRSASAINGDTTTVSALVWAICVDGDVLKGQVEQTRGANLDVTQMAMHVKRLWAIP